MITKTGKVEAGVTPSAASGRPSQVVRDGEALRNDENLSELTLEKIAARLGDPDVIELLAQDYHFL